jgi:hypothetical protein
LEGSGRSLTWDKSVFMTVARTNGGEPRKYQALHAFGPRMRTKICTKLQS